jgi:hypothetical protein
VNIFQHDVFSSFSGFIPFKPFGIVHQVRDRKFSFWWWVCLIYAVTVIIPCLVQASTPEVVKVSPEVNNGFFVSSEGDDKMFVKTRGNVLAGKHDNSIKESIVETLADYQEAITLVVETCKIGSDGSKHECTSNREDVRANAVYESIKDFFHGAVLGIIVSLPFYISSWRRTLSFMLLCDSTETMAWLSRQAMPNRAEAWRRTVILRYNV